MDIKKYISSGVIEAYIMGLASSEETAELEQLRKQHPEINQAILDFEEQLEKTIIENATPPPASVKNKIREKLFSSSDSQAEQMQTKVIPLQKNYWKHIAAAAIFLILISTGLNFYFYWQYKKSATAYNELLAGTR